MKTFRQFAMELVEAAMLPVLDEVFLVADKNSFETLHEGKWIGGRFDSNIRIDQATHLQGAAGPHAHVHGRRGKELVVVNFNGTGSHGTKGKLHSDDADALRARGFQIRPDNVVEWVVVQTMPEMLLG